MLTRWDTSPHLEIHLLLGRSDACRVCLAHCHSEATVHLVVMKFFCLWSLNPFRVFLAPVLSGE